MLYVRGSNANRELEHREADVTSRREARRRSEPEARGTGAAAPSWAALPPVLLLILLQFPILRLGYFWDDFYFLTFHGKGLLFPDPHFFRPIPLGLYFNLLRFLDPMNGHVAHLLNLALLSVAVLLFVKLASDLAGPRAGLFAGIVFAGYAHVSELVAWVSTSTDLLAILFVTAALLFRHRGHDLGALACATAALLSKESAVTVFPLLVLWDVLLGRPAKRGWLRLGAYSLIVIAWAMVHPGIHGLLRHGMQRGSASYVGVGHSELWGVHALRYGMSLLNLPPVGLRSEWMDARLATAIAGWIVAAASVLVLHHRLPTRPGVPLARIAAVSFVLSLPAVLMPTILVRHWAPYLACLPSLGTALLLGALLARQPKLVAIGVVGIFLVLGARSRGVRGDGEAVLSEPLMVEASEAVRTLRANLHRVFPTLPAGSQVSAYVTTSGLRGIQGALFEGQAPSLWYRDPTLRTVRIMDRDPHVPSEFLVRVTDELDVIVIDPTTAHGRTSAPRTLGLADLDPPLLAYARSIAATGETERAIGVLEGLSGIEAESSPDLAARNERIAASVLLASGREREADSILAVTQSFGPEISRDVVVRFLANPSPSEELDIAAFEAFGLSTSDPKTMRWMVRRLWDAGARAQAAWWARMLDASDPVRREILASAERQGIAPTRELAHPSRASGL